MDGSLHFAGFTSVMRGLACRSLRKAGKATGAFIVMRPGGTEVM